MCGIEPYGRMPSSGNPGPGYPVLPITRSVQPEGFGSVKLLALFRVEESSSETNRTLLIDTDYHS